jgi:lipopolysaccharide/colanic/teichoic acid biosynthesis glycosyltransferase
MYEFIAAILSKQVNRIKSAKDEKEKRVLFFQSLFWIVCSLIGLIIYIPPGLSIFEVLIAVSVFIITFYSVIRALKYFKIL